MKIMKIMKIIKIIKIIVEIINGIIIIVIVIVLMIIRIIITTIKITIVIVISIISYRHKINFSSNYNPTVTINTIKMKSHHKPLYSPLLIPVISTKTFPHWTKSTYFSFNNNQSLKYFSPTNPNIKNSLSKSSQNHHTTYNFYHY